jgi:hypothetical protein
LCCLNANAKEIMLPPSRKNPAAVDYRCVLLGQIWLVVRTLPVFFVLPVS